MAGHMAGPGGRRGGFERPKNARRTFARVLGYMLRQKWLMLCVLLCIAVSAGAGVFGTYMLKPIITDDIHISEADYGYIVSAFQAAYAVGLLFIGRIIDKFGTRISYAVAIVVWSLAGCFHAAARGALGFGIARFFLGLGESANFPAAIKATAEWFPVKERALATGIFNAGSNIGAVVSPIIVTCVTVAYGWQMAFIITGALGLVWMVFWLWCYRVPREAKGLSRAEYDYINQDEKTASAAAPEEEGPRPTWWALMKQRSTVGICLARFVCDWVWWFFLFWTPDFLEKAYGVHIQQMVLPLIVIYTFSSFGGIAGGYISSRLIALGRSVGFARRTGLLVCALLVIPVLLIPGIGSLWGSILIISLACFAHQGWASNIYTVVSDYYPKSSVATMTSMSSFAGSVGGVLAASFVGNVLEITGSYFVVFMIAGFAYLVAWALLQAFLPRRARA